MPTPIGGTSPYCTARQFLARADVRTVGDLLGDTGKRLTPDEVLASEVLAELLLESSGEFEAACFVGQRYALEDIQAIIDEDGAGAAMIAGMIAGVTLGKLFDRRPDRRAPAVQARTVEAAEQKMDALRHGERILPLREHAEAGRQHHTIDTPRDAEDRQLNTAIAKRFFGRRSSDYPQPPRP